MIRAMTLIKWWCSKCGIPEQEFWFRAADPKENIEGWRGQVLDAVHAKHGEMSLGCPAAGGLEAKMPVTGEGT